MRQTFIGLDFKKFGKLTFGKQNSAYKIPGDRTDITEANSGFANYVFSPGGSDGGITGTGRASSCLTYANKFLKRINFNCSGVFELNANADWLVRPVDAASVSAIADIGNGFDLALAYNRT